MIVVKVELWPGGEIERKREIATMAVANVSGLSPESSYVVTATEQASDVTGLPTRTVDFHVEGHARRQSVFALIAKAAERAANL